jgi:hypothetical protein
MSAPQLAELEDIRDVLAEAGYRCRMTAVADVSRVLLAENPYSLVAVFESETWNELAARVSDVQAEVTRLVSNEHAPLRWDLYVLVHVRNQTAQSIDSEKMESIESDTNYARKFIRINIAHTPTALDRALRPLLPLRPVARLDVVDSLQLIRDELLAQEVSSELADSAIAAFTRGEEVQLP